MPCLLLAVFFIGCSAAVSADDSAQPPTLGDSARTPTDSTDSTDSSASDTGDENTAVVAALGVASGLGWNQDGVPLDALQIQNVDADGAPIVPSGVPPAPDAYDGQFIQMDVVAVE